MGDETGFMANDSDTESFVGLVEELVSVEGSLEDESVIAIRSMAVIVPKREESLNNQATLIGINTRQ